MLGEFCFNVWFPLSIWDFVLNCIAWGFSLIFSNTVFELFLF